MENKETMFELKDRVDRYLVENYKIPVVKIRRKIAKKCLDLSDNGCEFTVLIRLFSRAKKIRIEKQKRQRIHRDELQFRFPSFHFRELPSGDNVGKRMDNGDYEILDEDKKVVNSVDSKTLKSFFVDSIIYNQEFQSLFEGLILAINGWITSKEQNEKGGEWK